MKELIYLPESYNSLSTRIRVVLPRAPTLPRPARLSSRLPPSRLVSLLYRPYLNFSSCPPPSRAGSDAGYSPFCTLRALFAWPYPRVISVRARTLDVRTYVDAFARTTVFNLFSRSSAPARLACSRARVKQLVLYPPRVYTLIYARARHVKIKTLPYLLPRVSATRTIYTAATRAFYFLAMDNLFTFDLRRVVMLIAPFFAPKHETREAQHGRRANPARISLFPFIRLSSLPREEFFHGFQHVDSRARDPSFSTL